MPRPQTHAAGDITLGVESQEDGGAGGYYECRPDASWEDPLVVQLNERQGRSDVWEFYETCFRENQG